jgi:hypothetical protein
MAKKAVKRVNMLWTGNELANLRECQQLLHLNDEAAAIRYLVARGMEALTGPLSLRRMFTKMEAQYAPQELLPLFEKMGVKLE